MRLVHRYKCLLLEQMKPLLLACKTPIMWPQHDGESKAVAFVCYFCLKYEEASRGDPVQLLLALLEMLVHYPWILKGSSM